MTRDADVLIVSIQNGGTCLEHTHTQARVLGQPGRHCKPSRSTADNHKIKSPGGKICRRRLWDPHHD
jgi:hypothetical protein